MNTPPEQDLRHRAERRVKLKMGFYIHAGIYVLVNLGLFALNGVAGGKPWALWPLAGWGLGLAIHGIVTFVNLRGEGVTGRMVEQELQRLRRRPPH
jgi:fatty acid desaturase